MQLFQDHPLGLMTTALPNEDGEVHPTQQGTYIPFILDSEESLDESGSETYVILRGKTNLSSQILDSWNKRLSSTSCIQTNHTSLPQTLRRRSPPQEKLCPPGSLALYKSMVPSVSIPTPLAHPLSRSCIIEPRISLSMAKKLDGFMSENELGNI